MNIWTTEFKLSPPSSLSCASLVDVSLIKIIFRLQFSQKHIFAIVADIYAVMLIHSYRNQLIEREAMAKMAKARKGKAVNMKGYNAAYAFANIKRQSMKKNKKNNKRLKNDFLKAKPIKTNPQYKSQFQQPTFRNAAQRVSVKRKEDQWAFAVAKTTPASQAVGNRKVQPSNFKQDSSMFGTGPRASLFDSKERTDMLRPKPRKGAFQSKAKKAMLVSRPSQQFLANYSANKDDYWGKAYTGSYLSSNNADSNLINSNVKTTLFWYVNENKIDTNAHNHIDRSICSFLVSNQVWLNYPHHVDLKSWWNRYFISIYMQP